MNRIEKRKSTTLEVDFESTALIKRTIMEARSAKVQKLMHPAVASGSSIAIDNRQSSSRSPTFLDVSHHLGQSNHLTLKDLGKLSLRVSKSVSRTISGGNYADPWLCLCRGRFGSRFAHSVVQMGLVSIEDPGDIDDKEEEKEIEAKDNGKKEFLTHERLFRIIYQQEMKWNGPRVTIYHYDYPLAEDTNAPPLPKLKYKEEDYTFVLQLSSVEGNVEDLLLTVAVPGDALDGRKKLKNCPAFWEEGCRSLDIELEEPLVFKKLSAAEEDNLLKNGKSSIDWKFLSHVKNLYATIHVLRRNKNGSISSCCIYQCDHPDDYYVDFFCDLYPDADTYEEREEKDEAYLNDERFVSFDETSLPCRVGFHGVDMPLSDDAKDHFKILSFKCNENERVRGSGVMIYPMFICHALKLASGEMGLCFTHFSFSASCVLHGEDYRECVSFENYHDNGYSPMMYSGGEIGHFLEGVFGWE